MPRDDVADLLRALGVRVSREAILALVAHATTSRLSPVQTLEELCAVARKEREQRSLKAFRFYTSAFARAEPPARLRRGRRSLAVPFGWLPECG